ncbi:MAG: Sir2 family NAD-dependent protein deacetylase [bacterium]
MLPPDCAAAVTAAIRGGRGVIVLTGAGISAESGIPTFRGEEGYWRIGSTHYRPEQMATLAQFRRTPDEVWRWYLYRRTVCQRATPNAGHRAVVALEAALQGRFALITQNVDGLHGRAGSSLARTCHVHGSLDHIRCAAACTVEIHPFPEGVADHAPDSPFTEADRALLVCPRCGDRARPHVLWFDECYDEAFYRFDTSLRLAEAAGLLITVGTSGATNLPNQVVDLVRRGRGVLVDVNPHENPFRHAARRAGGFGLEGGSGEWLPALVDTIEAALA